MRAINEKFADLGTPKRIWAVAAIHGELNRLAALHNELACRFTVGDRLVYLGNYLGVNAMQNAEVIEELLAFRSALLAKQGMEPHDIVFLRGPAEEAWQRLLRLQFAPLPVQSMEQLHHAGVDAYLRMHDVSVRDTKVIARAGSIAITRWTNRLRDMQRNAPGHDALMSQMRRAAVTQPHPETKQRVLFVPAGFDGAYSLEDQGETFWGKGSVFRLPENAPYSRVVRGCDPEYQGIDTEGAAVTLDGGCDRGGPLACGCFGFEGRLTDIIAVGGRGAVETFQDQPTTTETPEQEESFSVTQPDQWGEAAVART
jgi:hypothetical protein